MTTEPTNTPQEVIADGPENSGPKAWTLMVAALALVAVPVVAGYLLIQGDDSPSTNVGASDDSGMGGGMGSASEAETDTEHSDVLSFTAIQANDIVIESDPAGGGAVLRVNTLIDVACAVTYGLTPDLGSIATDTDMAGGGHTVHQPLMRGLNAGETYFYSVQAIAEDGSLYRSDIMTFTYTGEDGGGEEVVAPPAPNVAGQAQVTASSSEYSDAYGAIFAIDGDLSTEWSTAGDGDDAFITLTFQDRMIVKGVGFRTRSMTDGTSITLTYSVTVDGKQYGPFEAGPGLAVALADLEGYEFRFDVETSTGGNTGAIEVEVYGEAEM